MRSRLSAITGLGVGAAAMYLFDPAHGRRRRMGARDQMFHALRKSGRFFRVGARDLSHRARGVAAAGVHAIRHAPSSDEVLAARVRSAIGRLSSHPHAIDVGVINGRVTLYGPVLPNEVERLLSRVSKIDGVKEVDNRLEVHKHAEGISSLQGGRPRKPGRFELMQSNWAPGARVLVIAASIGPLLYGLKRRDVFGAFISAASSGFLARAITNMEAKRLFGLLGGAGRRSRDKTLLRNAYGFLFGPVAEIENDVAVLVRKNAVDL